MTSPDFQALYADHLAAMKRRADEALARGGFDHLVVPSGTLHYQLFDDRDYPYAVNPQFKAWLPLTRVPNSWLVYTPGQRPKVIFHQPFDYWHVVPDAPSGWWVEHFDIHIIRKPEEALALLPKPAARCAILGEAAKCAAADVRAEQSGGGDQLPGIPALVQDAVRNRADARSAAPGRARASRRRSRVPRRQERVRHPHGVLRRRGPGPGRTSLQQHRGPERTWRGAALHRARPHRAGAVAQFPDRCRRQLPRLRQRHHPLLCRRYFKRVPGADRCGGRGAAQDGRRRARRHRTTSSCTSTRTWP